jgi:hypothetical protein
LIEGILMPVSALFFELSVSAPWRLKLCKISVSLPSELPGTHASRQTRRNPSPSRQKKEKPKRPFFEAARIGGPFIPLSAKTGPGSRPSRPFRPFRHFLNLLASVHLLPHRNDHESQVDNSPIVGGKLDLRFQSPTGSTQSDK